jgi:hypothetical protein
MKKFLNLPRHGHRAGKVNNNFLNFLYNFLLLSYSYFVIL